jgi:hypothetical protein
MSGSDNQSETPKGFAGLGSLVSKIDAGQAEVEKLPAKSRQPVAAAGGAGSERAAQSQPHPHPLQQTSEPVRSRQAAPNSSALKKWLLAAVCLGGVVWWLGENPGSSGTQTRPSVSSTTAAIPTRPVEVRPPIGDDNVLSMSQLHYCLAEDIRLDGARSSLNNYSGADVDRFNLMISDYNSRCGNFRYRTGDLERARRAIEAFRSPILADGRSRF